MTGAGVGPPHPDDDPTWSPAEKRAADYLRDQRGYRVTGGGPTDRGRHYDLTLNPHGPADVKTLGPGSHSGTMRNEASASVRKGGQGRTLVCDVRQAGIDGSEARRGVQRIRGLFGPSGAEGHKLDRVIVIGDAFCLEEVL